MRRSIRLPRSSRRCRIAKTVKAIVPTMPAMNAPTTPPKPKKSSPPKNPVTSPQVSPTNGIVRSIADHENLSISKAAAANPRPIARPTEAQMTFIKTKSAIISTVPAASLERKNKLLEI
jgi:hypothetical protein